MSLFLLFIKNNFTFTEVHLTIQNIYNTFKVCHVLHILFCLFVCLFVSKSVEYGDIDLMLQGKRLSA